MKWKSEVERVVKQNNLTHADPAGTSVTGTKRLHTHIH